MHNSNRLAIHWKILGLLLAAISFGTPQSASADQVFNDDVIVIGSLGVGFDSTNGQAFGFDTIILKENNLRVLFDDTSVGAFPANDWELSANDSASGGASFFSIDDATAGRQIFRVDAGAPANSLKVDSGGRVGIGTATPVLNLHVATGNTPALRLEQNNSSGFTAQTWDVAGNEANFFIRDVTGGSTLPFRIFPGAPTSSILIAADGDIGVGTTSPSADINPGAAVDQASLHVRRTDRAATVFAESTGAFAAAFRAEAKNAVTQQARLDLVNNQLEFRLINNGNRLQWFDVTSNFESFTIRGTTGRAGFRNNNPAHPLQVGTAGDPTIGNGAHVTAAGVWTNGSTRKSKERIVDLDDEVALEAFDKLNPVTYFGKNQDDEQYVGFIAEDVPELVAMNGREGIAAIEIAALVTKVVQQQRATIESQQATIANLEKRVEKLEASQTAE